MDSCWKLKFWIAGIPAEKCAGLMVYKVSEKYQFQLVMKEPFYMIRMTCDLMWNLALPHLFFLTSLQRFEMFADISLDMISIMEILNEQFFGFFLNQLSKGTSKVWNVRVYCRYIVVILDMRFSAFIIDLSPKFWYSTYISMIFLATLARIFTFPLESLNSVVDLPSIFFTLGPLSPVSVISSFGINRISISPWFKVRLFFFKFKWKNYLKYVNKLFEPNINIFKLKNYLRMIFFYIFQYISFFKKKKNKYYYFLLLFWKILTIFMNFFLKFHFMVLLW